MSREVVFNNIETLSAQLNHHVPISAVKYNGLKAKLCDFAHSYNDT